MDDNKRILDAMGKLAEEVRTVKEDLIRAHEPSDNDQSSDTAELFAAMGKAQGEFDVASKDKQNPYFKSKYADLESIVSAARPALKAHGLSFMQIIRESIDGKNYLHTYLTHSSGQWMRSRIRISPPKNDMQTFGSYLSYLKRYALAALLGVVSADEDDDGETAMAADRQIYAKGKSHQFNPGEEPTPRVSRDQLDSLEYELNDMPELAEEIMNKMKINSLADMPKDKFQKTINWIRKYKENVNG